MCTIIFADGKQLSELTVNGTNFVSKTKVDETIFDSKNLATMTVDDGKQKYIYTDMVFVQQMELNGDYYLTFRKKTQREKDMERVSSVETATDELVLMMADMIGG